MTAVIRAGEGRVLALPGRIATEFVSASAGGHQVTLRRVVIPPDGDHPAARGTHRHGCTEVIVIVSGTGELDSPAGTSAVSAGDVVVVSPGDPHRTRNTGAADLVSLCFFPVGDLAAVTSEPPAGPGGRP